MPGFGRQMQQRQSQKKLVLTSPTLEKKKER